MVNLNDLISVIPNSISNKVCDDLISFFESNPEKHETLNNNGTPNFTQLNLTKNREEKEDIHNKLIQTVFKHRNGYYKHVHRDVFPDSHAFEEFRIKRYNTGGEDRFDTHVDVQNYQTARRFLSFFWYLNDVDEGGETEFDDLIIKPKKGTLVIFPPLWMFPHKGNPPISGTKYLLSTYLHYK
jgi:hypothetical protein|tara:strand:+ start:134 stop:682 length:549 start_codon:yes stop_codon:yes gene_type:complete